MIEFLAIPAHNAPPSTLEDWVAWLSGQGQSPRIAREDEDLVWLEIPALHVKGLVSFEGDRLEAVNFELHGPDAAPALGILHSLAANFAWELHEDDGLDDEDEDPEGD
jgi:hypothetical protein